jgi:hypothetical protein
MGEAKKRGTFEQRKTAAILRDSATQPERMVKKDTGRLCLEKIRQPSYIGQFIFLATSPYFDHFEPEKDEWTR